MRTYGELYGEPVTVTYALLRTIAERAYAHLDHDEEWPTNEELGGNYFTGTRDDELKHAARDYADSLIAALRPDIEGGLK